MIRSGNGVSGNLRLEADAVVVGTGAGGAVAAHRLRRAGKRVVLIEAGPYLQPDQFIRDAMAALPQLFYDNGVRMMVGNVVIPTMQARVVGGTTLVNSAVCFRLPDDVLDRWIEEEGLRDFSAGGLKPIFEEIERDLHIGPETDEYMGVHNLLLRKGCENLGWPGEPIMRNVKDCKGCGFCTPACYEGAKMSMDRTYVPDFVDLDGELVTDCRVEKVLVENGRAVGVTGVFTDPATHKPSEQTLEVRAKAVVLSCGTMGTAVLLLKNGLANSSGMVGRNLVNHPATGMMGCFEERVNAWEGANFGYCCTAFRRDGFVIEAVGSPPEMLAVRVTGLGLTHKNLMARLGHLAMWGALIQAKSTGRVRATRKSWTPIITYSLSRRDAYLFQVAMSAVVDLYFAAGAKFVTPGINRVPAFLHHPRDGRHILEAKLKASDFNIIGNHPAGTCRMSENRKQGVVDSHGETHDVKNLFVADGSILPDAPGVNPQETIMALSAHIAAYIGQAL